MKEKPIYEQLGYVPDPPFYAPTSKPIVTNYDRIISKTPEELAVWLSIYCRGKTPPYEPCRNSCEACWLDWLKQEATSEQID
jgi:hypothetical protein